MDTFEATAADTIAFLKSAAGGLRTSWATATALHVVLRPDLVRSLSEAAAGVHGGLPDVVSMEPAVARLGPGRGRIVS